MGCLLSAQASLELLSVCPMYYASDGSGMRPDHIYMVFSVQHWLWKYIAALHAPAGLAVATASTGARIGPVSDQERPNHAWHTVRYSLGISCTATVSHSALAAGELVVVMTEDGNTFALLLTCSSVTTSIRQAGA